MKTHRFLTWYNRRTLNKHLSMLLVVCLMTMIPVTTFAQLIKITMKKTNTTLQTVVRELEKQSGYSFFYNDNKVKLNKKISINVNEVAFEEVLKEVFKDSGYSYKIVDNQIVISSISPSHTPSTTQQKTARSIKGVVTDANGEPIIGASVIEKSRTTNGTITNINGQFSLDVYGNELEISYIGYGSQTVALKKDNSFYNVVLKEDTKTLDEVIVVGYSTQRKANLTGSISSLNTRDIKNRVQTNVLSAIQGTVPGVTIISRPGATPSINFRGRGNLGTSEPLYVIDGAISNATLFSNLDPNTIESISFLKDAASSAIYGSRAAYGVVLVTTKSGQKEKINISYNSYIGFSNPTYKPEYVNSAEYAKLYNEALYHSKPESGENQGYTEEEIALFANGSKADLYPNTDWNDLILKKDVMATQHSLNLSGGSDKLRFFVGLGYLYKDDMIPGKNEDRYNLNVNLSSDLTKWLTLKSGIKYIKKNNDRDCGEPSLASFSIVPVTFVAKQSNGFWGTVNGGKIGSSNFINYNPLRNLSKNDWSKSTSENTMYDLGFDVKPIKNLILSTQLFFYRNEYKGKSYTALQDNAINFLSNEEITGTGNTINKMFMDWQSVKKILYTSTAKYKWGNQTHDIEALIGTSYEHYNYERLKASRQDFPSDAMIDINAGSTSGAEYKNEGGVSEYKMLSYFGRLNYSLMGKYLFEANIRADASSRFHKENRWGYFPSVSLGWRIKEEAFLRKVDWLDNLKIRGSYGTLGNINNVGNYDYFQNYNSDVYYSFEGKLVNGVQEAKPANKKLSWETVSILDFGVDINIFNQMFGLTVDYYIKKTNDILLGYNVPSETGISNAPSQNIGNVRNCGIELAFNHQYHIKDLNYSIGANIATNKNKITNLGTSNDIIQKSSHVINYILREGESVGSYYGFKTNGLYTQEEIDNGDYYQMGGITPKAGDIKFVPQRKIEYKSEITNDDRTIIGKDVPDFTYGINLNLQYKGFELSLFGQGVSGTSVAYDVYGVHPFFHGMDNPRKFHLNRWTEANPNPNSIYPKLYSSSDPHTTYNRNFSDYQIFDADYFRIKNITLGYSFPKQLIQKINFETLKIYLTAENLFTLRSDNKMNDFDPESSSGVIYNLGSKSIALGVNLSF